MHQTATVHLQQSKTVSHNTFMYDLVAVHLHLLGSVLEFPKHVGDLKVDWFHQSWDKLKP